MELDHGSVRHYSKFVVFQDGNYYDEFDKESEAQYVADKYNGKIQGSTWTVRYRVYSEWEMN